MAGTNTTQMRDALAWATDDQEKAQDPSTNPFVWFWEAIQGDFNENRSTSQVLTDAAVSMIPLIDQICDVRDLIADCKKLTHDIKDKWAWVALVLTLIGLFPTIGSLVKGVLKIFFAFIRRFGGHETAKAVEAAMSWVISFLRRKNIQQYLKVHRIDFVFKWLADEIKALRAKINTQALLTAFDTGISALESLLHKVRLVPTAYQKAKGVLEQVKMIREAANTHIGEALKPVQDILTTIILRLERETLIKQHGILNTSNIHYRGVIPEPEAVALMGQRQPAWLSKKGGGNFIKPADLTDYEDDVKKLSAKLDNSGNPRPASEIFPPLTEQNILSFHTLKAETIKGPARIYRIIAPSSRSMSDCWVSEEVFKRLQNSPNPKEAWRRYLAVWPDWNVNGQFVIYDIKVGESLNVWRGPASSQEKVNLPGHFLEGGWEQILFSIDRSSTHNDTMLYHDIKKGNGATKPSPPLTQDEVNKLTANMDEQQRAVFFEENLMLREKINHPNISGPFDTGWGYTEFEGAITANKIGVPMLPGQLTRISN